MSTSSTVVLILLGLEAVVAALVFAHAAYHNKSLLWWLRASAALVFYNILLVGYHIFAPELSSKNAPPTEAKVTVPAYDYKPWHGMPVQFEGRMMPFETACIQVMRYITGMSKFEVTGTQSDDVWVKTWRRMTGKHDAIDSVAIVLQWMLLRGHSDTKDFVDWEHYAFILCSHHGLRQQIYAHLTEPLTEEQLHGKYISPADLRDSPGLRRLMAHVEDKRKADKEKFMQLLEPEERTAQEVSNRLVMFDSLTQGIPPSASKMRRTRQHPDPMHVVNLDKIRGGAWFSVGDLRGIEENPDQWRSEMHERLARTPQLYIAPKQKEALKEFQELVKAGRAQQALDALPEVQREQREQVMKMLRESQELGENYVLQFIYEVVLKSEDDRQRIATELHGVKDMKPEEKKSRLQKAVQECLIAQQKETIDNLQKRLRATQGGKRYVPDDPEFRMLHLDYLEARYPKLYHDSAAWQEFPKERADLVQSSFVKTVDAYKTLDAEKFAQASQDFLDTVQTVSEEYGTYPGDDTVSDRLRAVAGGPAPSNPGRELLSLEMRFNKVMPYMWAFFLR